jgi:hypothetical protein
VTSSLIDSSTALIHLNKQHNDKRNIPKIYLHHLFEVIVRKDGGEIPLNDSQVFQRYVFVE